MKVYLVRYTDLLDMEGSSDVAEVFGTKEAAEKYASEKVPATLRSGKPHEQWDVEEWEVK